MTRRIQVNFVIGLCLIGWPITSEAAIRYEVTILGTFGGTNSNGYAISDGGHATGDAQNLANNYRGFRYDGAMHDLGTLGGTENTGLGINNSGHVTGYSYTTGNASVRAFLYDGTMHNLGTLAGADSYGTDVNDDGQVTGYTQTGGHQRAFIYNGFMQDIGTLGGNESQAYAINNSGRVTGYSRIVGSSRHAFVYNGTMHDLGTLGGNESFGNDINDRGQVTGESRITGNATTHAFLWTPTVPNGVTGTMQDLGTLGGVTSEGLGMNVHGHVVGYSSTSGFAGRVAFLYTSATGMIDLNTLIDPSSGIDLIEATSSVRL